MEREESRLGYYHVVGRGVSKQVIFLDPKDFMYFYAAVLKEGEWDFEVPAWCLMDNHFHLLVKGDIESLRKKMQSLLGGYSRHFNFKYKRTGPLFDGHFFSEPINDFEYLVQVVRYIHQNPIKVLDCDIEGYMWSSYRQFLSDEASNTQLEIIERFGGREAFVKKHHYLVKGEFVGSEFKNRRISDHEALEIAKRTLGEDLSKRDLLLLPSRRREIFQSWLDSGMSFSQISRITGLSCEMVVSMLRKR